MNGAEYPSWIRAGDDGTLHLDAEEYARLRGITVPEAIAELEKMLGELLPGTPINVR